MNAHGIQAATAICPAARARLYAALDLLGEDQKAVLHLRYWEQQDLEDIASVLGTSPKTVNRLIQNSLAALRASLEQDESVFPFANVA